MKFYFEHTSGKINTEFEK